MRIELYVLELSKEIIEVPVGSIIIGVTYNIFDEICLHFLKTNNIEIEKRTFITLKYDCEIDITKHKFIGCIAKGTGKHAYIFEELK